MNLPLSVIFALFSAVLYGLANPLVKVAQMRGLSIGGLLVSTALPGLVIGLCLRGSLSPNFTLAGSSIAVLVGSMWTLAFIFWSSAISTKYNGLFSIIIIIVSLHPALSAIIGLAIFDEAHRVSVPKFSCGVLCILFGVRLVLTAIR